MIPRKVAPDRKSYAANSYARIIEPGEHYDHLQAIPSPVDCRPRRVLARRGVRHRLANAVHFRARLHEAAVCEMVRRRAHEPLPQRDRPASRDARLPKGADLHLDGNRREPDLYLRRAPRRGEPLCGRVERRGRGPRRPRAHLHADDRRSRVRNARVRADRRHSFRCVRRFRCRKPCHPHRRCEAESHGHIRLRNARRQGGSLQASGR